MWLNTSYHGVTIDNWRSVKEHFMIRYKGKTTFCHQIPKLVQDKTETFSDFAERCITEMREFMDSIQAPADNQYDTEYLAYTAAQKTCARDSGCLVVIDTLAKWCFLMGVNQAIRITLMQKQPAMLTQAIQEAMSLELINESNQNAKNKIANLDDEDLSVISEDLEDLTIKMINHKRAKSGRQPFKRTSQFPATKEKEAKAKTAGIRPLLSATTATRRGT